MEFFDLSPTITVRPLDGDRPIDASVFASGGTISLTRSGIECCAKNLEEDGIRRRFLNEVLAFPKHTVM
jgi:hypothetical protein